MRRTAAVVAVATLGLAACAGEEEGSSPGNRLAASPRATADAGSAAFSLDVSLPIGGRASGMEFTASGEGAMDMEGEKGRLELTLPAMGLSSTVIFINDTVYARVPAMFGGGENQWVRRVTRDTAADEDGEDDDETAAEDGGAEEEAAEGAGGPEGDTTDAGADDGPEFDREQLVRQMRRALDSIAGGISSLGVDSVRGDEVEGFGFTLSGDRLWEEDAEMPEEMSTEAADVSIPVEVWLDADDRIRRMVMKLDLAPFMEAARQRMADSLGTGAQQNPFGGMMAAMADTMTMTLELFDFGTAVDVQLPEGAEVIDADDFEPQMPQGAPRGQGTTARSGG